MRASIHPTFYSYLQPFHQDRGPPAPVFDNRSQRGLRGNAQFHKLCRVRARAFPAGNRGANSRAKRRTQPPALFSLLFVSGWFCPQLVLVPAGLVLFLSLLFSLLFFAFLLCFSFCCSFSSFSVSVFSVFSLLLFFFPCFLLSLLPSFPALYLFLFLYFSFSTSSLFPCSPRSLPG